MSGSLGGQDRRCSAALFQCVREATSTLGGGAHAIHRPHSAIYVGGGVFW